MLTEHDVIDSATSPIIAVGDRRRPGRQDVATELLPLLRGLDDAPGVEEGDQIPVASTGVIRGIVVGFALSVPLWGGLYWLYTVLI